MARIVNKKRLLLSRERQYVFYHRGSLFLDQRIDGTGRFLCRVPGSAIQRLFFHVPLLERMFRLSPHCAVWVDRESFLFAQKGVVYRVLLPSGQIFREHTFAQGMSAPLTFCKVSGLPGFSDGILYGTYIVRKKDCPIGIWHRSPDGTWQEAFRFPDQRVLHVHSIIPDAAKERLLILTGDSSEESVIWEAKNDFSEVRELLSGSQQCRACVAFPENGHILFATDTPCEQNYLYDYDETSRQVRAVAPMPGPVIYGKTLETGGRKRYLLATTVEPDSSLRGIRYLLTRKLAPGVRDRNTWLICGNLEEGFREAANFPKDGWPMALFQFGNLFFPEGDRADGCVCPQSLKHCHGKTVEVKELL